MIRRQAMARAALLMLLVARSAQPASQVETRELLDTHWALTHLGDKVLPPGPPEAEPSLMLQKNAARFSGSGGCNRLTGTYTLSGSSLAFGAVAATRMMCPSGMDTEAAFVAALEQVKAWRVQGRVLELVDGGGKVVARFAASDRRATPAGGAPGMFVNKVWQVVRPSAVAPGTLYVFLSEGTLVVTSSKGKPSLGTWKYEKDTLTMTEEGIAYRVDILKLGDDEFSIRSHNPRGSVEIVLKPAVPPSK